VCVDDVHVQPKRVNICPILVWILFVGADVGCTTDVSEILSLVLGLPIFIGQVHMSTLSADGKTAGCLSNISIPRTFSLYY